MKRSTLLLFLACAAVSIFFSAKPSAFAYTREQIGAGEMWRGVSSHFVHFSSHHLCTNLAALALLLCLMPAVSKPQLIWLSVFTPALLAVSLYFSRPELVTYGGLSGWLSAVFIFIAVERARVHAWTGLFYKVAIAAFLTKMLFEFSSGGSLLTTLGQGVLVEPAAHAVGATLGFIGIYLNPRPSGRCNQILESRLPQ